MLWAASPPCRPPRSPASGSSGSLAGTGGPQPSASAPRQPAASLPRRQRPSTPPCRPASSIRASCASTAPWPAGAPTVAGRRSRRSSDHRPCRLACRGRDAACGGARRVGRRGRSGRRVAVHPMSASELSPSRSAAPRTLTPPFFFGNPREGRRRHPAHSAPKIGATAASGKTEGRTGQPHLTSPPGKSGGSRTPKSAARCRFAQHKIRASPQPARRRRTPSASAGLIASSSRPSCCSAARSRRRSRSRCRSRSRHTGSARRRRIRAAFASRLNGTPPAWLSAPGAQRRGAQHKIRAGRHRRQQPSGIPAGQSAHPAPQRHDDTPRHDDPSRRVQDRQPHERRCQSRLRPWRHERSHHAARQRPTTPTAPAARRGGHPPAPHQRRARRRYRRPRRTPSSSAPHPTQAGTSCRTNHMTAAAVRSAGRPAPWLDTETNTRRRR